MSRRQCSVWGCSNRKGRCPEDVEGRIHCKCPELRGKDCPESSAMLSLHSVGKMPQKVYQIVVQKMNQTRMDQRGAQWKPGPETYICNFHYDGFKGPTRADPSIVPTLFKRPHDFYSQPAKNRVDFWIVFRTILMIVNHLHRIHLSLHSSNWERSTWNTRMRLKGLKSMYKT